MTNEKMIEDIRSAILEMLDEKREDLAKRQPAYQAAYLAGVLDSLAVVRQFRVNASYCRSLETICPVPDFPDYSLLDPYKEKE